MAKISKIKKVKNLGLVFSDFSWKPATPSFKEVNLVYGWNGCGKTTLTRWFSEVEESSQSNIQYEFEVEDGTSFKEADEFTTSIRVFNQDYIEENVRILDSRANTISILLGATNKKLVEQIRRDETTLNGDANDPKNVGKLHEFQGYTQKKQRKEKENEKAFSEVAKTIGAAISGRSGAPRNYRSPNAKKDFANLTEPRLLTDDEIEKSTLAIRQEMLDELDPIEAKAISTDGVKHNIIESLSNCYEQGRKLSATSVEAEAISRLTENPDIAEWVEQGKLLHERHESDKCEYCGNAISPARLLQLAKHFNDEDRRLKERIEVVLAQLREIHGFLTRMSLYDEVRLYHELREKYRLVENEFEQSKALLLAQVTALGTILRDKKAETNKVVPLEVKFDVQKFQSALSSLNSVLNEHNVKTKGFQAIQADAEKKLTEHHLSSIFEDVTNRRKEIETLEEDLVKREQEISIVQARIAHARSQISSTHKACTQISENLTTFLGRNELTFTPDIEVVTNDDGIQEEITTGYKIMRGEKPATRLSEGEKTAIAFVYFVVHLSDGQFQKQNGIVVVDDPVSSLDSNSLYQAFSFLKNAVKDCEQVIILTHNFDFLKLLINWRGGARKKKTGFYMVNNYMDGDSRRASIDAMDSELQEYESEYHYLFKRLREMRDEQDGSIARAYPVPNIARKVWESFLMYRVPNSQSFYLKMDMLKNTGFDAQKLDAIYKFTNDQSHITGAGFNPSLVPETKKVLNEIFEMMKTIAPDHYSVLDEATK
ncbi:AAA family ATPase [Parvibaculum sp.]|uniref:AAA family ATPase n=1 Tax=Parvibaculum sp. TaxID=2024848 RepID=UPI000C8F990A|nr:AAA family ATPase [Parvibaculum sp.]MAB13157.1 hypothetical protein [Parvibaculum sp.]